MVDLTCLVANLIANLKVQMLVDGVKICFASQVNLNSVCHLAIVNFGIF